MIQKSTTIKNKLTMKCVKIQHVCVSLRRIYLRKCKKRDRENSLLFMIAICWQFWRSCTARAAKTDSAQSREKHH